MEKILRRSGVRMTSYAAWSITGASLGTRVPCSSTVRRSLTSSLVILAGGAFSGSSFAARAVQCRCIVVETNETPNPDCMRFFSMDVSFLKPEFSMDIPSPAQAYKSPLAEALFGVAGVQAVFLADEYVTVRKHPQADWAALIPIIKEVIVEFAESKENVLSAAGEEELLGYNNDTEPDDDDDEVVLAVKELLATRIRPMLRADGGNVRFIDMDEGTVFLLLEGSCKSCPSSHVTLKSGIERMLMHWIPEVVEAQEVSDEVAVDILSEKRLRKQLKEKGEVVKAK
ncbi:conserved hypothetical protein [Leishmania infantum JPCM5]|uniref:Scaffold_protein_Nfu/NifU_N_terminal/NifU-like_domain_containing_protein_-_putative n=2 Tax=Leishmania infantum TaxID=5671 RepID=A0A6L0XRX7_LEIIN|nr:conserved hypothetical protein [Leishmania infantum JPCM5]CAC9495768.1 Scaffold_protein_Nfu/NifU_N_terminal/NifU-like_domain_containing_protein_-_putative [Leishmania infantum]CAM68738.1 conserved hypothetical protein [Leishmania infantum JPCM5]SUZ42610.1 Scaffold_protein_Nfu/NifU_N_terminal/NifU-like_domain_containing_protein_-_putative [Leishmania infantum]|eukprot:XP_001470367.1 conserved hypothetical protein [Leishmania infantum JPCM5]